MGIPCAYLPGMPIIHLTRNVDIVTPNVGASNFVKNLARVGLEPTLERF